jgi:hypothetical protein
LRTMKEPKNNGEHTLTKIEIVHIFPLLIIVYIV